MKITNDENKVIEGLKHYLAGDKSALTNNEYVKAYARLSSYEKENVRKAMAEHKDELLKQYTIKHLSPEIVENPSKNKELFDILDTMKGNNLPLIAWNVVYNSIHKMDKDEFHNLLVKYSNNLNVLKLLNEMRRK